MQFIQHILSLPIYIPLNYGSSMLSTQDGLHFCLQSIMNTSFLTKHLTLSQILKIHITGFASVPL